MRGYIDPKTATKVASIQEFFTKSAGFAKLVFAQGEAAEKFKALCPLQITEIDCS